MCVNISYRFWIMKRQLSDDSCFDLQKPYARLNKQMSRRTCELYNGIIQNYKKKKKKKMPKFKTKLMMMTEQRNSQILFLWIHFVFYRYFLHSFALFAQCNNNDCERRSARHENESYTVWLFAFIVELINSGYSLWWRCAHMCVCARFSFHFCS